MVINRRGFMGIILASLAAPAIVRAESLMKIVVPQPLIVGMETIWLPPGFPDKSDPLGERGFVGAKCWKDGRQYALRYSFYEPRCMDVGLWEPPVNERLARLTVEHDLRRLVLESPSEVRMIAGVTPSTREFA